LGPEVSLESTSEALRNRTKAFALRIIRLFRALPRKTDAQVIGKQLLRSGTSIGANYRAACVARSKTEFASRTAVVLEEADETVFWIELLVESGMMPGKRLEPLLNEAQELTRIFAASRRTASGGREKL
jgi:four helix bundle protein